jgi:hypothetical protein
MVPMPTLAFQLPSSREATPEQDNPIKLKQPTADARTSRGTTSKAATIRLASMPKHKPTPIAATFVTRNELLLPSSYRHGAARKKPPDTIQKREALTLA